ncbi:hypothetical protein PR048_001890, partial [Dryococelus australis]
MLNDKIKKLDLIQEETQELKKQKKTFHYQKYPLVMHSAGVSFGPITFAYILVRLILLTSICIMKQLLENHPRNKRFHTIFLCLGIAFYHVVIVWFYRKFNEEEGICLHSSSFTHFKKVIIKASKKKSQYRIFEYRM